MVEGSKILVVDDREENRILLQNYLIAMNEIPILAENGLSALVTIEKEKPDLILLDILMPKMRCATYLYHFLLEIIQMIF